jgi:2-keto-4-pentenoate hydratase/2-oxohepta-3-ene-1,7-dioic acid hydratase in catechol pathway
VRIARCGGPEGVIGFGVVEGVDGGITPESTFTPIAGHPFGQFELAGPAVPLEGLRLLAPTLPSKVIAVGRNYAEHARELGNDVPDEPIIFLKPSTSVIGPGEAIVLPEQSEQVEHEAELAVVISRLCKEVPIHRVPEVILGYTIANDVTARDLQRADGQWTRGKGFDTFCPLGPWIETDLDATDLDLTCTVNDELRQATRTSQMERSAAELVAWISNVMTLLPGDVILTGTPAGVGPLVAGDSVSVTISSIGTLTNRVVSS